MNKLVREDIETQGAATTIYVEVDDAAYDEETLGAARHGGTRGGGEANVRPFEKGMELVRSTAGLVATTMQELAVAARPDEFEVTFAIKFTTQVGAFIAKTGTDAQLQVRLKWQNKPGAK